MRSSLDENRWGGRIIRLVQAQHMPGIQTSVHVQHVRGAGILRPVHDIRLSDGAVQRGLVKGRPVDVRTLLDKVVDTEAVGEDVRDVLRGLVEAELGARLICPGAH